MLTSHHRHSDIVLKQKRKHSGHYNVKLLIPVLLLIGIGIVMVYSASSTLAQEHFNGEYHFLRKQALFALFGIIVLIGFKNFPYAYFAYLTYPLIILSLIFLAAIEIPGIGMEVNGASRWLRLGILTFQPSEFARFVLVIYLAYSMSKKENSIRFFSIGFLPHFIILVLFALLFLNQPDFGSIIIFGALTWIMLFVGGVPIIHLLSPLPFLAGLLFILMNQKPYIIDRFMGFLNPWKHASDEGYQLVHSFMAFGSGGLFGTGFGQSYQKLFYLPEPHTDFIFAIIGEEMGFIGVIVILALFVAVLHSGISIALRSDESFGSLLAMGLTTALALQLFVNLGVTLGLLPTKGLTLPFLSYGGTSLLVSMASVGILLNIEGTTT
jgi:cell division protein FtsW